MKAFLKNYHQSPRKVRLVATLITGKKVNTALTELDFIERRASLPIKQLIMSAVANAENNFNLDRGDLYIKELRVDKGIVMKRMMPGAHGRGYPLKRRTSHVAVLLDIKIEKEKVKKTEKTSPKTKEVKAEKPKVAKKVVAKKAVKK